MTAIARPLTGSLPIGGRAVLVGMLAAAALLGVYLTIVSVAQGVEHAFEQLAADALFVGLIAAGFGIQIALFVELRAVDRRHRAAAAVTAAGTGTSAAAMLACCAHHLVDLLPLLGLSAAAVFLNAYKTPLFLVGIAMNVIGIVVIARQLQRARRACAAIDGAANTPDPTVTKHIPDAVGHSAPENHPRGDSDERDPWRNAQARLRSAAEGPFGTSGRCDRQPPAARPGATVAADRTTEVHR